MLESAQKAAPFFYKHQPVSGDLALFYRERSVTARVISATKVIKLADLYTLAFLFVFLWFNRVMEDIDQQLDRAPIIKYKTVPIRGIVVCGLILAIMLLTKNPGTGGPQLIIAFLFMTFLLLTCVFSLFLQVVWSILKVSNPHSWIRLLYSSVVLAFGSVFLIGLQTLGQLRIIDVILVVLFELVLIFYTLRRF
jgi:hypothetical protein